MVKMVIALLVVILIINLFQLAYYNASRGECIEKFVVIDPKDCKYRLLAIKVFLQNTLRTLNIYLGTEGEADETPLINLIYRIEYQLKQIDDILTDYGRMK